MTAVRSRAPVPPRPLPPGRTVLVPGRGELFLRDTGGTGPVVLLVHGWLFASDLNWLRQYAPLARAGYRVLAADLRGHGRGLRSSEPFTFEDCADDLAGMLAALDVDRAVVVGYSMGGPVAQLLARRSPERVAGLVLCATALDWQDARQRLLWRTMSGLRLLLGAFPQGSWSAMVRRSGGDPATSSWVAAELSRGSARDLAEAGRALGRFNSAGWVGGLPQPTAVVVTGLDRLVPPRPCSARRSRTARPTPTPHRCPPARRGRCGPRRRPGAPWSRPTATWSSAAPRPAPTGPAGVRTWRRPASW